MDTAPSCEVLVAGGGPVGATLALALAQGGTDVILLDAAPEGRSSPARAYAVAPGPFRAWEALGASPAADRTQPVTGMSVADGPAAGAAAAAWALRAAIRFDAAEGDGGPLAWLAESAGLEPALRAALARAGVRILAGARVAAIASGPAGADVRLPDGRRVRATLVVGADGRGSPVREAAGIGRLGWAYRQEGVTATVRLARPHGGVARQLFLPGGPLAVLPLAGDRASLVWSAPPAQAAALVDATPELFETALARALGEAGARLDGGRARFPLELRLAERMTAPRVALAGDAAQTIHPVAGQGLNLGLKDAAALAEVVLDARRLGEDLGGAAVLDRYARWRRFDRLALAAGTDAFVRAFSTDAPPLRLARSLAFGAAAALAPARRAFMREASGLAGDPPRLFAGLQP